MECNQQFKWLIIAMICPLFAGAPSSMSKRDSSCPKENLNITGGTFVLSKGYSHGSLLRYICPNGHYPSVQSRLCQEGHWTSKTKTRKTPECKNHMSKSLCFREWRAVRVCKPNGKWSGSTPVCECDSDHCPDPGNMFNIGDKVTYRCESPLTLIGSKVRVCLDGGQWSGTEPQCYADFTYDTPKEASEAFSSSLKSSLAVSQQYEKEDQQGKKITMNQGGKLDIYIAVDASGSIYERDFENAKTTIKMLIEKISYYPVSPNYEILIFATYVTRIISMRDFKNNEDARNLMNILKELDDFNYEHIGEHTGTNIAKVYTTIFQSMKIEELNNATTFSETQHIVILFTDGQANMGGDPKRKVNPIKHLVTKNDPMRERNLDLYVFGVGDDVYLEYINGLVSQRDQEKYFFKLRDLTEVQEMFDDMIDESTSVGLCGIVWEGLENKRRAFPWLAQINIQHPSTSKGSNCMGSLVSSSYILTGATCFKEGDTPDKIIVKLEKGLVVKVKKYTLHPKYNPKAKQHIGIQEYYEFDVALIQLEKAVEMSFNLRPICIPCTRETNGALKLSESEGTCRKHEEILLNNELVEAAFTSDMDNDNSPKYIKNIMIKLGKYRDACVEDAKKAEGLNVKNAREVVTDNFLCSGGNEPKTDDVACKGDSGGATYVNKKGRVIQVGVVSWGVKDVCKEKRRFISDADSRDYHSNLFSEEIRSFLKDHLENDRIGQPLTFL
uniref:C3/C5 convertase n=1 Tax=Cyprinus carpio carpio TaxID=630221 RepID=A0A8C1AI14_CYPCA